MKVARYASTQVLIASCSACGIQWVARGKETGMYRQGIGNGIRGPTRPDKANDRAGNAAVRETDRSGSGTNQPSRVSRYLRLAPAASVDGRRSDVKVGGGDSARIIMHGYSLRRSMVARAGRPVDRSNGQRSGVAGNRAAVCVRPIRGVSPLLRSQKVGSVQ